MSFDALLMGGSGNADCDLGTLSVRAVHKLVAGLDRPDVSTSYEVYDMGGTQLQLDQGHLEVHGRNGSDRSEVRMNAAELPVLTLHAIFLKKIWAAHDDCSMQIAPRRILVYRSSTSSSTSSSTMCLERLPSSS